MASRIRGPVFKETLNKILSSLFGKICFVYIDDIVIFSKNPREHAEHLNIVFQRLREVGLKVKRKKCYFGKKEVELLGYQVSAQGIAPQESKVKAIKYLPQPQDKKGMTNYYRQCIKDYIKISRPL